MKLGLIAAATAVATIAVPAAARADSAEFVFEEPSGNIVCHMTAGADGTGAVACDIEHTTPNPAAIRWLYSHRHSIIPRPGEPR